MFYVKQNVLNSFLFCSLHAPVLHALLFLSFTSFFSQQSCEANLGSTDLWRPLHSLHLLSVTNSSGQDTNTLPPRSVFVITDGHMTEEGPTLSAIRNGTKTSRVFTFGVR